VAPHVDDDTWRLAAAVLAAREGGSRRPASVAAWDLELQCGEEKRKLRVRPHGATVEVNADGRSVAVQLESLEGHELRHAIDGVSRRVLCVPDGSQVHLVRNGTAFSFAEVSPWPSANAAVDPRLARAPVAGTVAAVSVAPGDVVEAGQPLVCVEAMKMEMWLTARSGGRVLAVHATLRESVEAGAVLVELEIEETA
jgi:geranyl-CoA carboxylase alpha subunit